MKKHKYTVLLLILLVFSFFIRVYKINNLSLFGDEIDVGYQAFSLLTTGHDYKGNFLPVYIQSLSESRAPLLIYTSIPGIKIFGLNEFGVRITPIIFGILSIFLFYKLIILLSKSNKLALFSATTLSFSPWHFHYSRVSFEVTLLLSLILAATYFFILFTQKLKNKYLYFSIITFGLTFYTYNTANIFVPLFVLFLLFSNFKIIKSQVKLKTIFISIVLSLIFIIPILNQILYGQAATRFSSLSIINNPKIIDQIINKRTIFSASNLSIERLFHNKPIAIGKEFIKNYIQSISPDFLFINGDTLNIRHTIPGFGLIFISFLPFLLLGLFSLDFKKTENKLMFFWLLFSPIPSALTLNGGAHATRLFLMIIPITYFIGLGIFKTSQFKFSKLIYLALILSVIFESTLYSHEYFVHYPKDFSSPWNFGYKEIFKNIPITPSNRIFISNSNFNSLLYFLFYQNIFPNKTIQIHDQEKQNITDNMSGFKLNDKIFFINNWDNMVGFYNEMLNKLNQIAQPGDVFVLFQINEIPGDINLSINKSLNNFNVIKVIFNPNGTILAQIIQKQ